ncbi:MAG: hypothetical protein HQM12_05280 [SAR324 cluster bacterium]|nr:hypothetical protein [SAR324 cluster bacterium]
MLEVFLTESGGKIAFDAPAVEWSATRRTRGQQNDGEQKNRDEFSRWAL